MKLLFPLACLTTMLLSSSCNDSGRYSGQDEAEVAIANETGQDTPLPRDVLYASKPLISGKLYARPSFGGTIIAHFDTSQQLHIIDTTDNVFVKVRMLLDTATHTGYASKVILPEQH